MSTEHPVVTEPGRNRVVSVIFALVLVCAALSLGRIVIEPVAFVLFTMALVEPFQRTAVARVGKTIGLLLTILLTLLVLSFLVYAIVWSLGEIVHWGFANLE